MYLTPKFGVLLEANNATIVCISSLKIDVTVYVLLTTSAIIQLNLSVKLCCLTFSLML
jgi:hypothetical protein